MTELEYLEDLAGGSWTGLRFETDAPRRSSGLGRLCAAVGRSFYAETVLDCEQLSCVGAPRNLGRDGDDDGLAGRMAEHTGLSPEAAERIISQTPRLAEPAGLIRLGRVTDPDVLVGYVAPESAMKLLRRWQLVHGSVLDMPLSSFMSVCSCVAAAAGEGRPAISFGCKDARTHGGLPDGRLVVALPATLVRTLRDGRC